MRAGLPGKPNKRSKLDFRIVPTPTLPSHINGLVPIPDESTRVEWSSQDSYDPLLTHSNMETPDTAAYIRNNCGESPTAYTTQMITMTNTLDTNYVRAVNDYSTSLHEIWTKNFTVPATKTAIINCGSVNFINLDAFIDKLLIKLSIGTAGLTSYASDYHDEEEEKSPYTTYAQRIILGYMDDGRTTDEIFGFEALGSVEGSYFTIISTNKRVTDSFVEAIQTLKGEYKVEKPRKEKTFHTISSGRNGFQLEDLKLKTQYDESIVLENYNDDFQKVDLVIKEAIHENKKGLILLHGIPGSGKTSYIKHLITSPSERKIVYVPTHLTGAIASPSFISFVKESLSNAVLVIEDAEQVLLNRDSVESQKEAVSNILNMTDGILAEALNILIICTFNTDMENLDKALLRKGRLLVRYHFDKLSKEKTKIMCQKLYGREVEGSLSLADIYGLDYELIAPEEPKKVKMGFLKG